MIEIKEDKGKIDNSNNELLPGVNKSLIKRHTNFWTRKTNLPTYEIAGSLERYDARDTTNARAGLVPGTERYRIYYELHPELEEGDKKMRPFKSTEEKEKRKYELFGKEVFVWALNNAGKIDNYNDPRYSFFEKEESILENKIEISPELAARNIKGVALYLGADMVGISRINPAWVYSHTASDRDGLLWGDPIHLEHTHAISMVIKDYDFDLLLAGRGGFSLIPNMEVKVTPLNIGIIITQRLASYIRNLGYSAKSHLFGGTQVLNIPLAVDAGLGEMGRSGMLITKKFGPAVRILTVTTDLPMAVDKPVDIGVQDLCVKCKKCAEVCSVQAISYKDEKEVVRGIKMWPVDNEACRRLKCAHGGDWTCFYCMSACCWTKPQNLLHLTAAEMAARFSVARTVLAWLDDVLYGHKPRQHHLPDWLSFNGSKPGLKERISTFLHHV